MIYIPLQHLEAELWSKAHVEAGSCFREKFVKMRLCEMRQQILGAIMQKCASNYRCHDLTLVAR